MTTRHSVKATSARWAKKRDSVATRPKATTAQSVRSSRGCGIRRGRACRPTSSTARTAQAAAVTSVNTSTGEKR